MDRDDARPAEDDTRGPAPAGADDMLEVLSESECWQLLRTVDVGRIAMAVDDGSVDIFPINFVVDHGTIVFRTAAGTKLTRVAQSAEVSFEADDADRPNTNAWSVVIKGEAKTIKGGTDLFDTFDLDLRPWHSATKPFFVRLVPRSVSGRRFVRSI